ncbi:MAG: MurR/RpiR family transcriptional regulator [Tissierellia bacterium]|jgi:DNA-binding MurR/RpiR family transcriptional regulator|nr:MurR/RpiR family transcriptional regulator [Tissierellia bacterium]
MKTIIKLIYENYDSFTSSKKLIADFILNNSNYILYDTLSELAHKINTSTTSIIRFARDLGYSGYSEMQEALREFAALDDPFDAQKTLSKVQDKNISELFESSINKDIENLQHTIKSIPKDKLEEAINLIAKSRKVYITGYNDSFALAFYMALRLGQVRDNVDLLQSVGGMYPKDIVNSNEEDVLIAYFFPRYSLYTLNIIKWVSSNGGKVIIITSNNIEKIRDFGDVILPTHVYGGGVKESLIAPMSLSSYIASSVAIVNGDEAKEIIGKAENILRSGLYLDNK